VKTLATGKSEHRNEQFETIERLKQSYQAAGNPVMSMDTKRELYAFGEQPMQVYRDGKLYTREPIEVFDHDWQRLQPGLPFLMGCTI